MNLVAAFFPPFFPPNGGKLCRFQRFLVSKPHELWPLSHCKTWRPQGESNPRRRRERAVSWASRRWGRWTFQEERIVEIPVRASSMGRIR